MAPAADVTDQEYRAARLHQIAVLLVTGLGIFAGWYVWDQKWIVITIPILGVFTTPTIFGLVFHLVARCTFRRAAELKTPRLRNYPEYKRFLHASKAFEKDAKVKKEDAAE